MYLEYVTEKKVDQSRETIVPAFKPKARIFVCGFGQTRQSWAEALRSWRKKLKGKAFDGDLYVAAGFGEDILLSRDETFCDYPHNYYSGDAEIYDFEEETLADALCDSYREWLAHYDTIEIVAHSFGVRLAAYIINSFPEEWFKTKTIRGIALAGTVTAVGDGVGVPEENWARTLDGLSVATMEQFYLNLFNTPESYFNLRGFPGSVYSARKRQNPFRTQTEFKERLLACTLTNLDIKYADLATDVCYKSARSYLFYRPSSVMRDMTGWSYSSQKEQRMMLLSAEMCFPRVAPLGALGRSRFDQCFKLHYAYGDDLICPAEAIQGDLTQAGVTGYEVRELKCPHLNVGQICELLLEPNHPDWEHVGALIAAAS